MNFHLKKSNFAFMDDIRAFDFERMFFGEEPKMFLLEIVLRTAIMYTYTILLIRFLGKRSMGQLSTLELAIIIGFGSAVGDPMLGIDVPISHGIVVITSIALIQVILEYFINRNKKLEVFMEGKPDLLIDNGIINCEQLKKNKLSHEDLFRFLRGKEVENFGEVNKAYFETSGLVSVIFHASKNVKPGLSVLPCDNPGSQLFTSNKHIPEDGYYSCGVCGSTQQLETSSTFNTCKNCKSMLWSKSVL